MYQKSQNYLWPTPGSSAPRPARHAAGSEDNTGWQGHFQPHRTGSEGGVTVPLPGGTSEDGEMLAMAPSVKRKTATTESNSGKKEPRTSRGQRKETQRNTPNATKTPQMPPKRPKRHQTPQTPPNTVPGPSRYLRRVQTILRVSLIRKIRKPFLKRTRNGASTPNVFSPFWGDRPHTHTQDGSVEDGVGEARGHTLRGL